MYTYTHTRARVPHVPLPQPSKMSSQPKMTRPKPVVHGSWQTMPAGPALAKGVAAQLGFLLAPAESCRHRHIYGQMFCSLPGLRVAVHTGRAHLNPRCDGQTCVLWTLRDYTWPSPGACVCFPPACLLCYPPPKSTLSLQVPCLPGSWFTWGWDLTSRSLRPCGPLSFLTPYSPSVFSSASHVLCTPRECQRRDGFRLTAQPYGSQGADCWPAATIGWILGSPLSCCVFHTEASVCIVLP